jgi:hypothetical protein
MNLLPFVVIFIFVLTLGIQFSFSTYQRVLIERLGMEGSIFVYRKAYNKKEKKLFTKELLALKESPAAEAPKAKAEGQKELIKRDEKDYKSHRLSLTENSKFCLDTLLDNPQPHLEETLVRLLDSLYGNMELLQKEKHKESRYLSLFVRELLTNLRRQPKGARSFLEVKFVDKKTELIWYKMQKGTFEDPKGWPPLGDYVTLGLSKERKPIVFCKCSLPLLEAFFSKDIREAILLKEKEKFISGSKTSVLTAEELSAILEGQFASEKIHLGYQNAPLTSSKQKIEDRKSGVYIITSLPLQKEEEDNASIEKTK